MKRTTTLLIIIVLIIGLFTLLTLAAYSVGAQTPEQLPPDNGQANLQSSGGQFSIRRSVVAGGGAMMQQPGAKTVSTTGGQTVAGGHPSGGSFKIDSGFWTPNDLAPSAAGVSVSGRITVASGAGLRNALVVLTDPNGGWRTVITGPFGYYRFDDVEAGHTYILTVTSKRYQFASRLLNIVEDLADVDLNASQ